MTYQSFISTLSSEIREKRSWPENASGNKLADQIRIIYGAVLAMALQPNAHLWLFKNNQQEVQLDEGNWYDYPIFDLPDDIFYIREDMGLHLINIDEAQFTPQEAMSFYQFKETIDNHWQQGNYCFHINGVQNQLFVNDSYEVIISYVPLFEKPTASNYDSLELPIPPGHQDRLTQLVSMHVEAAINGNQNKSAVHNALAKLYGV